MSDENLKRIRQYDTPSNPAHLNKALDSLRGNRTRFSRSVRSGGITDMMNPYRDLLRAEYAKGMERISNATGLTPKEITKGTDLPTSLPSEADVFQTKLPLTEEAPDIILPP